MTQAHNLGFPRIGKKRELKFAVEKYWREEISLQELEDIGRELRKKHWQLQADAGLASVPVGDFSWYDHVLDTTALVGALPKRAGLEEGENVDLNTYFRVARGRAPSGEPITAGELTKWFDTNYHYIVPELTEDQTFYIASDKLFNEIKEAKALGHAVKPVLLGPVSFLWLAKEKQSTFNKLTLLPKLLSVYQAIFERLEKENITWVQIDEPILALDLQQSWLQAFRQAYETLGQSTLQLLLTTYFDTIEDKLALVTSLPIEGIHIDLARAPHQLDTFHAHWPKNKVLSVGAVDGRNIWRTDLNKWTQTLATLADERGDNLWVGPSCSLLHSPVDLSIEEKLDDEIKSWLAFATQKLNELSLLSDSLSHKTLSSKQQHALNTNKQAIHSRQKSTRIHRPEVNKRLHAVTDADSERQHPYAIRAEKQDRRFNLPLFPTTTIGSFPQTKDIRTLRSQLKKGTLGPEDYTVQIKSHIAQVISEQEALGLDVFVHGEAERNDMVEYFGEHLEGFAFTQSGWVQSYGSRCVKPPVIYGDVWRSQPITVDWISYAQSLTKKPVKGMLTGPTTILAWSFVRDDQPDQVTAYQIALALRDEVQDLEKAGIDIIQIDEPAFRELLPLRKAKRAEYLQWAVTAFRLASTGVGDETQIHTHMCYSEFNHIIDSIASLDADVITIETSRSHMELLEVFEDFNYPNEIGPGVYDIHSPNIPTAKEIEKLIDKAVVSIPKERLWINPDCGLKTRGWPETREALREMVSAARRLREKYSQFYSEST